MQCRHSMHVQTDPAETKQELVGVNLMGELCVLLQRLVHPIVKWKDKSALKTALYLEVSDPSLGCVTGAVQLLKNLQTTPSNHCKQYSVHIDHKQTTLRVFVKNPKNQRAEWSRKLLCTNWHFERWVYHACEVYSAWNAKKLSFKSHEALFTQQQHKALYRPKTIKKKIRKHIECPPNTPPPHSHTHHNESYNYTWIKSKWKWKLK